MPKPRIYTYSRPTLEAARLFGLEVSRARRRRHWTAVDLAERAGISPITLRKVERGDPTVGLGIAFEVATLLGIPLFGATRDELPALVGLAEDRLALLPERVREPMSEVHDEF